MERKEPYANQEEFNRRVAFCRDIPLIEIKPGVKSHIISAEKITVSFVEGEPNAFVPIHHHESEQITIVTNGACDFIVDGKLYHLEEGDTIILPSNAEHGAYLLDKGCHLTEVFSPPRQDYMAKLEAVKKSLEK